MENDMRADVVRIIDQMLKLGTEYMSYKLCNMEETVIIFGDCDNCAFKVVYDTEGWLSYSADGNIPETFRSVDAWIKHFEE